LIGCPFSTFTIIDSYSAIFDALNPKQQPAREPKNIATAMIKIRTVVLYTAGKNITQKAE